MRSPHRRALRQTTCRQSKSGSRMDTAHFERLVASERRKKPAQSSGEHRLTRARWTYEQNVVTPGSGDLERAPRDDMAAHVHKVRSARGLSSVGP